MSGKNLKVEIAEYLFDEFAKDDETFDFFLDIAGDVFTLVKERILERIAEVFGE